MKSKWFEQRPVLKIVGISGSITNTWISLLIRNSRNQLRDATRQATLQHAFHIRIERHPQYFVDDVGNQTAQLGRFLDLVLSLAEDDAQCALARTQVGQDVPVLSISGSPLKRNMLAQSRPWGMMAGRLNGGFDRSSAILRKSRYVNCPTSSP
jgi:hypothetical protein